MTNKFTMPVPEYSQNWHNLNQFNNLICQTPAFFRWEQFLKHSLHKSTLRHRGHGWSILDCPPLPSCGHKQILCLSPKGQGDHVQTGIVGVLPLLDGLQTIFKHGSALDVLWQSLSKFCQMQTKLIDTILTLYWIYIDTHSKYYQNIVKWTSPWHHQ